MARFKAQRGRNALLAIVITAPLLVACNAVLGISDYSKAECSGGGSDCLGGPDSGPDKDSALDANDGGNVVLVDARGADPVVWATFKMPNYDGGPTENPPDLSDGKDGDDKIVTDNTTKRSWRAVKDNEHTPMAWSKAATFCQEAGTGWRLPTRIELVTLLDFGRPVVRADERLGLEAAPYWTTSLDRHRLANNTVEITALHWVVHFGVEGAPKPVSTLSEAETSVAQVICVKAKQ